MKLTRLAEVCVAYVCLAVAPAFGGAGEPKIRITVIDAANEVIKGVVEGLSAEQAAEHRVAVYVRTDKWYIHPYEKSVAVINRDGSWEIEHVRRGFEERMAALLVAKTVALPSTTGDLDSIQAKASCTVPYSPKFALAPEEEKKEREEKGENEQKEEKKAPQATIRITEINAADGVIRGVVEGLPPKERDGYIVAVYVRTDMWYIHPYLESAATIQKDGSWEIEHVRRGEERRLAAFVVSKAVRRPKTMQFSFLEHIAKTEMPYNESYKAPAEPKKGEPGAQPAQPAKPEARRPEIRIQTIDAARSIVNGVVAGLSKDETVEHVVVLYVYTDMWYVHPYRGSAAAIKTDGSWESRHVRRGGERGMAAVVIPKGTAPPPNVQMLNDIKSGAVAAVPYKEQFADQGQGAQAWAGPERIRFANRSWLVKDCFGGPGPNRFSSTAVSLDKEENLHLKVFRDGKDWVCGEIICEEALGYGDYRFRFSGRLDELDPRVVLGLFIYGGDRREIDFELARWGDPNAKNAQFVVQPARNDTMFRFSAGSATELTCSLLWEPGRVRFRCWRGSPDPEKEGEPIAEWSYAGPFVPKATDERFRMNLWLMGGKPPLNGQGVEVAIRGFDFTRLGADASSSPVRVRVLVGEPSAWPRTLRVLVGEPLFSGAN